MNHSVKFVHQVDEEHVAKAIQRIRYREHPGWSKMNEPVRIGRNPATRHSPSLFHVSAKRRVSGVGARA